MATPKRVRKCTNLSLDVDYSSLSDIMRQIQRYRKDLTRAGWTNLKVEMTNTDGYDDSGRTYPYIFGERMETMDEAEKREASEEAFAASKRERDRAEFERLRKQFEGQ